MIGFPNSTYQNQFPTCSVIKFELNPADQLKFFSGGKPTVLMRYTVSQDYTLKNCPGKVFHTFTNSSLPNHADCFFDRTNTHLDRNRTNPITIYQNCNLPYCTCQAKQITPPKPTPYKPSIFPRWGRGTNPINQEIAKEFCPPSQMKMISQNILAPMLPVQESTQRNIKFEQDRKRCSMDTDGKNPHENKRVHRDACVSHLVWPICKIDNSEYSKWFNIQILKAMTIFHQGMARLMAWVQFVNSQEINWVLSIRS